MIFEQRQCFDFVCLYVAVNEIAVRCNQQNKSKLQVFVEKLHNQIIWLSLIHISEPTRQEAISYAVFCLKKKHYNDYFTHLLSNAVIKDSSHDNYLQQKACFGVKKTKQTY